MDYPDNCIRGIKNRRYVNDDGTVTSDLFFFNLKDRGDGWSELSINWEDESNVVDFTLQQKKTNGEFRFKGGAAILPRKEVDRIKNLPLIRGLLAYERRPDLENNNPFHGNIIMNAQTLNNTMKQIGAGLALAVHRVEPPKSN